MKEPADEADTRLWSIVTATVRPLKTRRRRAVEPAPVKSPSQPVTTAAPKGLPRPPTRPKGPSPVKKAPRPPPPAPPEAIEPGRRRRLERGRDLPAALIDLHHLNQDEARAALTAFILRAYAEHRRNVLVITGKGALGDGVLRRRVPDWLGEAPLRRVVAGISEAHRRHGGGGALYVALRRSET